MNSLKNKFKYLYALIFFISIGIIIFTLKTSGSADLFIDNNDIVKYESNWKSLNMNGEKKDINIPMENRGTEKILITHTIDEKVDDNRYLFFKCSNKKIKVYVDEEEIYSSNERLTLFPFNEYAWNVIELKEEYSGKNIRIEDASYGSLYSIDKINLAKDRISILYYVMIHEFPSIAASFILIVLSLILFFMWIFTKKLVKNNKILYLSVLLILLSAVFIINTSSIKLIINNMKFFNITSCEMLMLIPIAIILHYLVKEDNTLPGFIQFMPILNFTVCNLLYFMGNIDLAQVTMITNVFIIAESIVFSGLYIYNISMKKEKDVSAANIGFIIMTASMILHIINYYLLYNTAYISIANIGILIYILTLGYDVIVEILNLFIKGKEADIYKVLAYRDILTNVFNRFAFEEEMHNINNNYSAIREALLIMIDINNLKSINDSNGHECGDRYIINNIKYIERKIKNLGSIYRIGGDEFVVISSGKNLKKLKDIFASMEKEMLCHNENVNFAFGFASFDYNVDKNIYDTLKRADKSMYENKKTFKNGL